MPATLEQLDKLESDPRLWRYTLFPKHHRNASGEYVPEAPHHGELWSWIWDIDRSRRPRPFIAIWGRGGAKSTSAELGTLALGATGRRRYALYVSRTQERADDHVQAIASAMESPLFGTFYPAHAERKVGLYGTSRGWRRNRVATAGGFTVDALGLDTASRGAKIDEDRPDLIVLDDVDRTHDSIHVTAKVRDTITKDLLPAGAQTVAVLAIQNLIHPKSIFSELAGLTDEPADWLVDRIISGPIPAIHGLTYAADPNGRFLITAGEPSWVGYDLAAAQAEIDAIGITAFLEEAQHEVQAPPGGMFDHLDFGSMRVPLAQLPQMVRIVVWVDPAVTKSDSSDSQAVAVVGLGTDNRLYILHAWEKRETPVIALTIAIRQALRWRAQHVGIETDQGGDTWGSVWREAKAIVLAGDDEHPPLEQDDAAFVRRLAWRQEKAGAGDAPKAHRAQQTLADFETGQVRTLVGTHTIAENGLRRFPKTKPLDWVDAWYWCWHDLRDKGEVAAATRDDAKAIQKAVTAERRSRWR